MKKRSILFMVMMLIAQTNFGQELYREKNVTINYDGFQKIGTRYEEKCKASLDVYKVTGTVRNLNSDKAVKLLGTSLTFNGNDCGWYEGKYRIEDETYSINFSNTQLWNQQWVDILPGKSLTLQGEVLLRQDRKIELPRYNLNFTLVGVQEKAVQTQMPPAKTSLKWSDWKPFNIDGCNPNLEYRYVTERGYALNYQVHMWFEIKNNNNQAVSYLFNLLDDKGKVHFGQQRANQAGETIRFVHKMSGDIIKKWNLLNLVYTNTGKSVCETLNGKQSITLNQTSTSQVDHQMAPKPETVLEARTKMKAVIEAMSAYLVENTPGVPTTVMKNGKSVVETRYFKSSVKFKVSGCDGTITDIVITGENATYNENARRTLKQLDGKYTVVVNGYCFTQPATILLTD